MNLDRLVDYMTLMNKVITLGSPIVPLFAYILRKLRLISQKPAEQRNELMEFIAIVSFGFFGSVLGLFILLGAATVIALVIGIHLYQAATTMAQDGSIGGLPPLHLDGSSLISAGVSIVSTILIFGGKNKLRGLAFLAGNCLGASIGIMIVASWFLH